MEEQPEQDGEIHAVGRMLTAMLKKFGSLRCTPTPPTYTSPPPRDEA